MFRSSRTLAIVGIPLVAVAVAIVALTTGGGDANQTGTLAAIFAVPPCAVLFQNFSELAF